MSGMFKAFFILVLDTMVGVKETSKIRRSPSQAIPLMSYHKDYTSSMCFLVVFGRCNSLLACMPWYFTCLPSLTTSAPIFGAISLPVLLAVVVLFVTIGLGVLVVVGIVELLVVVVGIVIPVIVVGLND